MIEYKRRSGTNHRERTKSSDLLSKTFRKTITIANRLSRLIFNKVFSLLSYYSFNDKNLYEYDSKRTKKGDS